MNRVPRRIFGPKRDEVAGEWRKLHDELRDLYSSPNIIRMIKQIKEDGMSGAYSTNGEYEERAKVIGGKARGKETTMKTKT
jgi:hypothetical protein